MYADGAGVDMDYLKALYWLERAVRAMPAAAVVTRHATLCRQGTPAERANKQAAEWFQNGASAVRLSMAWRGVARVRVRAC
jgi:TPR repeat protein